MSGQQRRPGRPPTSSSSQGTYLGRQPPLLHTKHLCLQHESTQRSLPPCLHYAAQLALCPSPPPPQEDGAQSILVLGSTNHGVQILPLLMSGAVFMFRRALNIETRGQHLAAGRSILLITTMTFFSSSKAFRSTKRVCGIGPSTESTKSSTPVQPPIPAIYHQFHPPFFCVTPLSPQRPLLQAIHLPKTASLPCERCPSQGPPPPSLPVTCHSRLSATSACGHSPSLTYIPET